MANSTKPAYPFGDMSDAAKAMPLQMVAFWRSALNLPVVTTAEMMRFAASRLMAQAEHISALAKCEDVSTAIESQTSFVQTAAKAYREEAEVLAKEVQDAVSGLQKAA